MKIKAVLIDFDGALVDTEMVLYESWRKVYGIFGYKLNIEYWVMNLRPERPDAAAYYALQQYMAEPPTPEAAQSLQRRFEAELMNEIDTRPGMNELLSICKKKFKIQVAVITSSKGSVIESYLNKLKLYSFVDVVVTCDNVNGREKPDPACYNYALSKLSCKPEYGLAIEDSPKGIAAAKSAGLKVVVFPNKITELMNLTKADGVIHNGLEILPVFDDKQYFGHEIKSPVGSTSSNCCFERNK